MYGGFPYQSESFELFHPILLRSLKQVIDNKWKHSAILFHSRLIKHNASNKRAKGIEGVIRVAENPEML